MIYAPQKHHRRSLRLEDYNYAHSGAYFITIVAQNRQCIFGEVVNGKIELNQFGHILAEEWEKSESIRQEIELDAFVVMPNHIHGIVIMNSDVGATGRSPSPSGPPKRSLGAFVGGFKSAVTTRINQFRGTPGAAIWQRNYYEHVIRNEESLNRIRQYIVDNPTRWSFDPENPTAISPEPKDAWLMPDRPLTRLQSRVGATGLSPLRIQTPSKGS
jgi:putative transposase